MQVDEDDFHKELDLDKDLLEVEHYYNDYYVVDYCKEVDSKMVEEVVDLFDPYLSDTHTTLGEKLVQDY